MVAEKINLKGPGMARIINTLSEWNAISATG